MTPPIFVALDTTDLATAKAWAEATAPFVAGVKLGLEFTYAHGLDGVRQVAADVPLFLDLKLHDIPNTVAGGIAAILGQVRPRYLNVHAGGGPAMLARAAETVARLGGGETRLLAVTVLTSLDDDDLATVGQARPASDQVLRLARLAQVNGCDGVVCSPAEIAMLREAMGPDFDLVVPGIRPAGADTADQKRVMTPADAVAAGATRLVIGRPITAAKDPGAAARGIAETLMA